MTFSSQFTSWGSPPSPCSGYLTRTAWLEMEQRRSSHTWFHAIEADLGRLNLVLVIAWRKATTQDEWCHIVDTAMLQWSTLWKKKEWWHRPFNFPEISVIEITEKVVKMVLKCLLKLLGIKSLENSSVNFQYCCRHLGRPCQRPK